MVPAMTYPEIQTAPNGSLRGVLTQCEAEGGGFLDRIITDDETWCHHYESETTIHAMATKEFPVWVTSS